MKNLTLQIDDLVLSSNFGLGRIVGFEKMGDGDQEFAVIESMEKRIKVMAPMSKSPNFRKLSKPSVLKQKLEDLKSMDGSLSFDSKKDRITYFKGRGQKQDLDSLLQTIAQLRALDDRGSAENKIFESLVNNLELEVKTVLEIDVEQANKMVSTSLAG